MNEINHIWTVICKKGLIESTSNVLSLIEIMEKIEVNLANKIDFSEKTPITIPLSFEIISFWQKGKKFDNSTGEARISIYSPVGTELVKIPIKFEILSNPRSRTILKVDGLPITGSGQYKVVVEKKVDKDYVKVSEVPFDLLINAK